MTSDGTGAPRIPLTEVQRQIWLTDQLGGDASTAYNESVSMELRGELNHAALAAALERLVGRHEMLRAAISPDGDSQVISPPGPVVIRERDFTALAPDEREAQLARWLISEAREPFDLGRAPLLRISLATLAADRFVLAFTIHHIVFDTWSLGVLQRELGALYTALAGSVAPELPPAPRYGDFVTWHQRWMADPAFADAERFWLGQYAAPPAPMELPADAARPTVRTFAAARVLGVLPPAETARLRAFCAERELALYDVLLAAFNSLLHALSGQPDLAVGIHLPGQPAAGMPGLVGLCINLQPQRSEIDWERPAAEYLAATARRLEDSRRHQWYPFSALLRQLGIRRDPARAPLISTMFHVEPRLELQLAGMSMIRGAAVENGAATWDLRLCVVEGAELALEWKYNTTLFAAATIERWQAHYLRVLAAMTGPAPLAMAAVRDQILAGEQTARDQTRTALQAARAQKFKQLKAKIPSHVSTEEPTS